MLPRKTSWFPMSLCLPLGEPGQISKRSDKHGGRHLPDSVFPPDPLLNLFPWHSKHTPIKDSYNQSLASSPNQSIRKYKSFHRHRKARSVSSSLRDGPEPHTTPPLSVVHTGLSAGTHTPRVGKGCGDSGFTLQLPRGVHLRPGVLIPPDHVFSFVPMPPSTVKALHRLMGEFPTHIHCHRPGPYEAERPQPWTSSSVRPSVRPNDRFFVFSMQALPSWLSDMDRVAQIHSHYDQNQLLRSLSFSLKVLTLPHALALRSLPLLVSLIYIPSGLD